MRVQILWDTSSIPNGENFFSTRIFLQNILCNLFLSFSYNFWIDAVFLVQKKWEKKFKSYDNTLTDQLESDKCLDVII